MHITAELIARTVEDAIPRLACDLREDVACALHTAARQETDERGALVLRQLCQNACIASQDRLPICQDTGTVWVCLELGQDCVLEGDPFVLLDAAVARAYKEHALRMSTLRDALCDRSNPGTNGPVFTELKFVEGCGATLHIMLKGGGSDNASCVEMLPPGAGWDGVKHIVLERVRKKAANACPPLVVGVGVGATFDRVAGLAKHALLRAVDDPSPNPQLAVYEAELLEAINATGIGAGALGGSCTALACHIETAPCHIAALPVAVNLGCSAMRSVSIRLDDDADGGLAQHASADAFASTSIDAQHQAGKTKRLQLPVSREDLAGLRAGDAVLLSGPVYTARDAGHARLLEALEQTGGLPFGLDGHTIFYAGPTPPAAGRPLGAVGPTTASRMDFAAPRLHKAGIVATIGKGTRNDEVRQACIDTGSIYFAAVGGSAALLAKCVVVAETIAWDDLGTEALRRLELEDFPCFVALDTQGGDIYAQR